jgi:hypothetical protein
MNILYLISNSQSFHLTLDRVEELFMIEKEEFKNSYYYLPYTLTGNISSVKPMIDFATQHSDEIMDINEYAKTIASLSKVPLF